MSRSRSWTFTLNNYEAKDEAEILDVFEMGAITYFVYGREVGVEGTPHLQGYVVLRNAKTRSAVRKFLFEKRAHWEIRRGTNEQAASYCKKDDLEYCERGVLPQDPLEKGAGERERWETALDACKRGEFEMVPADILLRHLGNCLRVQRQFGTESMARLDEKCGYWFCGPPGTGKSFTARERFPEAYIKSANKWWDGYQFQEAVIMDEAELNTEKLGHHLKIWADIYPFQAEVKNGSMMIRPKAFVVTSNYSIEEIFGNNSQMAKAIARRFQVVHFREFFKK